MKTKVANKEEVTGKSIRNQNREPITLTVFAILFIITLGMFMLAT